MKIFISNAKIVPTGWRGIMAKEGSAAGYFPIIFGLALGLMIVHPPEALRSLGGASYLIMIGVAFAAIFAFTIFSLSKNLPASIEMTPDRTSAVPEDVRSIADQFLTAGFDQAALPLIVGTTPPALVIPFVHEKEKTYGTVFRTGTVPAKTSYDLFSYFQNIEGGLTTGPNPQGAAFPTTSGSFRQVFPGAGVKELFEKHRQALAFLKMRKIECKNVSQSSFSEDYKKSFARMRKGFLKNPLSFASVVLWRAITKKTPHIGLIQMQPGTKKQIDQLLSH